MSLYNELGGAPAVSVALDRFYARVPGHPVIGRFFDGIDFAQLKTRAAPFVTMALGGPAEYGGPGLRNVHKYNGDHERREERGLEPIAAAPEAGSRSPAVIETPAAGCDRLRLLGPPS
jgi:hemoglobin